MASENIHGANLASAILGKPGGTQFLEVAKYRMTLKQISSENWICAYPNKAPKVVQGLDGISEYAREIEAQEIEAQEIAEDLKGV